MQAIITVDWKDAEGGGHDTFQVECSLEEFHQIESRLVETYEAALEVDAGGELVELSINALEEVQPYRSREIVEDALGYVKLMAGER